MLEITCVCNSAIFLIYERFVILLKSIVVDGLYCVGLALHFVQLFSVPLVNDLS